MQDLFARLKGPQNASRRVLAVVGLAFATMGLSWGYAVSQLDPTSHVAVLDELAVPASWDLAHTEVVKSPIFGSRVERYYLVDADPEALVDPITGILTVAGFTVDVRTASRDWCDNRPLGATPTIVCPTKVIPDCSSNGEDPMTCHLSARRGGDRLSISALARGRASHLLRRNGLTLRRRSRSDRRPGDGRVLSRPRTLVLTCDYLVTYSPGMTDPMAPVFRALADPIGASCSTGSSSAMARRWESCARTCPG